MRRNRTKHVPPDFTSRPWRIQFEQAPLTDAWVYKFPIAESTGRWIELSGRIRSAYRTIEEAIQFIEESHGLSGKLWRALLEQLEHTRPLPIEGVFEGAIFSVRGRLLMRSIWMDDDDAVRIPSLDEAGVHAGCDEILKRRIAK